MKYAILTKSTAQKLVSCISSRQKETSVSLDLGKSTEKVVLGEDFVLLRGEKISKKALEKTKEDTCYIAEDNELKSVNFFSQDTNLFYKLRPTSEWPTLTLSSVPMHRFAHVGPKRHVEMMLKEISPIRGRVLDTCCGLGYTAIGEANTPEVKEVVVFEIDENVLRIAEHNPYSEELFTNKKIKLKIENVFEGITKLPNNYFDRVLHDPPTVSFAKELYFEEFYKELFRVMKKGGILYHYCPNPGKTKGKELHPSIVKWLTKVGFSNCEHHEKSSGVVAIKK